MSVTVAQIYHDDARGSCLKLMSVDVIHLLHRWAQPKIKKNEETRYFAMFFVENCQCNDIILENLR